MLQEFLPLWLILGGFVVVLVVALVVSARRVEIAGTVKPPICTAPTLVS